MHIPENYLSPSTCVVLAGTMVPVLACALKKVRRTVSCEKMPLLGVAAAFCFLSMMFNVPLPGGTTGHAVCGTLAAILFGPWAATLAVSIALVIQAVLFGDGGILALGANCFNMAFVLPMVGHAVYEALSERMDGLRGELVGAAVGSYAGINAAALMTAIELGIQPLLFTNAAGQALYCPYPLALSVPAMMAGHLTVFGAAEVIFTVGILAYLRKAAPSFALGADPSMHKVPGAVVGLVITLIAATPLGLMATGTAWGEWGASEVAQAVGYMPSGMQGWEWSSLIPSYSLGSLPEWMGYVVSAIIGVALLTIVFRMLGATMRPEVSFGDE